VPADHTSKWHGQVVGYRRSTRRGRCRMPTLARHRCHKGVTPARIVGDVALSRTAVPKRLAQRGDMNPKRTLVDNRIGPGAGDQLILAYRLAGAFDKRDEDVQGSAAEA